MTGVQTCALPICRSSADITKCIHFKFLFRHNLSLLNYPDNPLHPNSNVRKFLEQWIGRALTEQEMKNFHLRMIVGARGQLVTQVATTADGKRRFAKLTAISPPPTGIQSWQYAGTVVRVRQHPGQTYLTAEGVRIEETAPQATQQQPAQQQVAQQVAQQAAPAAEVPF